MGHGTCKQGLWHRLQKKETTCNDSSNFDSIRWLNPDVKHAGVCFSFESTHLSHPWANSGQCKRQRQRHVKDDKVLPAKQSQRRWQHHFESRLRLKRLDPKRSLVPRRHWDNQHAATSQLLLARNGRWRHLHMGWFRKARQAHSDDLRPNQYRYGAYHWDIPCRRT